MKRAITFGEIMLRLSPPGFQRFGQAKSFDVVYGGAESNASVSLANYGLDSAFVTLVPDNPLGQSSQQTPIAIVRKEENAQDDILPEDPEE